MLRYETLILAVPEITSSEAENLEKQLDKIFKTHSASMLSFEKWGKVRLMYPVRKNDYGVYFLVRYELEHNDGLIKEIDNLFKVKLNDLVMRSIVSELDVKKSLEYKRPQSVDQVSTKDVDDFIKENKMEGLLQSTAEIEEDDIVEIEQAVKEE